MGFTPMTRGGHVGGFALDPAPASIPGIWRWDGNGVLPTLDRQVRYAGWIGRIQCGVMVEGAD